MSGSLNHSLHRTTVDVAPERNGTPFEDGKRLTDTYQYRAACLCGWTGETLPTAGEARTSGREHREREKWLAAENERARAMVLENTYIPWA